MMSQRSYFVTLAVMICMMTGSVLAAELPRYRFIWLRHADTTVWITDDMDVTDDGTIVYQGVLRLSDDSPLGSPTMAVTVYKNGSFIPLQLNDDSATIAGEVAINSSETIISKQYQRSPHIHPAIMGVGSPATQMMVPDTTHPDSPTNSAFPCMWANGYDINDNGLVIGTAGGGDNFFARTDEMYLWSADGTPQKITDPGGLDETKTKADQRSWIDRNGNIASTLGNNGFAGAPSSWAIAGLAFGTQIISMPGPNYQSAQVTGMSDNGIVVGHYLVGSLDSVRSKSRMYGFVSHDQSLGLDIGALANDASDPQIVPRDVNDNGIILATVGVGVGASGSTLFYPSGSSLIGTNFVTLIDEGEDPSGKIFVGLKIDNNNRIYGGFTSAASGGHLLPFILEPIVPGFCVNSGSDAPDISPGDDECWTGEFDSQGRKVCSMRAAIMESNANAGVDTICFAIPGDTIIYTQSALPVVTDPVFIDGLTQAGGRPHLNGQFQASGDGLVVEAGYSTIRGLSINRFPGVGLTLRTLDSNVVENCWIGTDETETDALSNGSHGILIDQSNGNKIGRAGALDRANTIAWNGLDGVYVQSGVQNTIFTNHFFKNDGLAIDLAPDGVNANDSLDADTGPNTGLNFPVIESMQGGFLSGRYVGEPNETVIVEVYRTDTCDASLHGEGHEALALTTTVDTDANGVGTVLIDLRGETLTGTEVFTALAHDADNTSEFSLCWPTKTIQLIDDSSRVIANEWFELLTVANDPPTYTETLLDTVTTDDSGKVDLREYLLQETLTAGSQFKLQRHLWSEPSLKHPIQLPSSYSVHLDNVKFDSLGRIDIETIDTEPNQITIMDHTTIAFNLLVSIEWDASESYLQTTADGFRQMSNYLYDVSDGQMRVDTVAIYDDKFEWDVADFQIHAQNVLTPHVDRVGGLLRAPGAAGDPVEMPRKWYGTEDKGRNLSAIEHPLDLNNVKDMRTRTHEFGHYALILLDEYKGPSGAVTCSVPPRSGGTIGMMGAQYVSFGRYSSELSTASAYGDTSCQHTYQWASYGASCWDVVDAVWTKTYGGLLSPILRPQERMLASGSDFVPGPNDDPSNLDYDVGAMVQFPVAVASPATVSLFVLTTDSAGAAVPKMTVVTVDTVDFRSPNKQIYQGLSSDSGRITVLGYRTNYEMLYWGGGLTVLGAGLAASAGSHEEWWFGQASHDPVNGDSVTLVASVVQGDYPIIVGADLGANDATLKLIMTSPFDSIPRLDYSPVDSPTTAYSFVSAGTGFDVLVTDSLRSSGVFWVWAQDDSNQTFFFSAPFEVTQLDSSVGWHMRGPAGSAEFDLDPVNGPAPRALIIQSSYPVIRSGLDVAARQLGDAHTLDIQSLGSLVGFNVLTMRYLDSDLPSDSLAFTNEESARLFLWNDGLEVWEMVGGSVDTVNNEVTAQILSDGVYALFTTSISTDIGDGGSNEVLPDRFDLKQNFPNPFNVSTMITYTLASPAYVRVTVFNILGQEVRILDEGTKSAGRYELIWDGKDRSGSVVSSGLYFYKLEAGDHQAIRKMMLLK